MTDARITGLTREALRSASAPVRINTGVREVLRAGQAEARVAQVCREIMRSRGFVPNETRFTGAVREILRTSAATIARRPHLLFAAIS